jgi:hypothetical protein
MHHRYSHSNTQHPDTGKIVTTNQQVDLKMDNFVQRLFANDTEGLDTRSCGRKTKCPPVQTAMPSYRPLPTANVCRSCLQTICESHTLLWRRDSYSLSRKLFSICHMVLKGVFPNNIGVLAMRETILRVSNIAAAVLCQEENEVLLCSSQTSSYLSLMYYSAII